MNLRTKLLIGFLSCGLIPLAVSGLISLQTARQGMDKINSSASKGLSDLAEDQLTAIRDLKKQQVTAYFDTLDAMIVNFAANPTTVEALKSFTEAFPRFKSEAGFDNPLQARRELAQYYQQDFAAEFNRQNPTERIDAAATAYCGQLTDEAVALQLAYLKRNPNPLGSKQRLEQSEFKTQYDRVHSQMHPIVRSFLEQFSLYDVFFVDAATGQVVYSVFKEVDFTTSLVDGPLARSNLAEAYRRSLSTTDTKHGVLVDFEPYLPSYRAPASFIAAPVMEGGNRIGAVVFQVPLDRISMIMSDRSGLGETGETILVGSDFLPRTDSFRDPEHRSVVAAFRKPDLAKIETKGIRLAVTEGKSGFGTLNDYMGNEVISAFCPVEILGLKWALTAKRDTAEAFASTRAMNEVANVASSRLLWSSVIVSVIAVLVIVTTSLISAKRYGALEAISKENAAKLLAVDKSQAVIEFNMDGTVITANDNFLKTMGYTLDEIRGQHHRIFCDNTTQNSAEYADFWARLGRGEFAGGVYQRVAKGGKPVWVQARYTPIRDLNGKLVKVVKYASDITNSVEFRSEMTENLTRVVLNLNDSARNLSSTAVQLTDGAGTTSNLSTNVSAAAEQMSVSMSGISASTEQMSQNVRTVAAAIEEMTASIADVSSNAERAASVAQLAASLTETSSGKISQLGTAATEIGRVIEVIQDIAEQTNLLALNATIEAARAGTAGKGFAVVATEVKELAKQTSTATDEIRARIEAIQSATSEAIAAIGEIESVIRDVNSVSQTIARTVDQQRLATQEISKNVSETTLAVETVSKSISESAVASREITQSMTKVDTAAKQTAGGATQAKGAGDQLVTLAEQLDALVKKFSVDQSSVA